MPSPPLPPTGFHRNARRRAIALVAAALVGGLLVPPGDARADTIPVNTVEVRVDEDEVLLNADFELSLNATLEEALQKGVPLYFLLEVDLVRPRRYWFDEKVSQYATQYRVSWLPLTRQYRVASGLLSLNFDSLQEVERFIGRVTARAIARANELERGARYEALVRLRLDPNQLPKPFQVNALASRDWQLASETRRVAFAP